MIQSKLPHDMIREILSYCDVETILMKLCLLNREIFRIIFFESYELWEQHLSRLENRIYQEQKPKQSPYKIIEIDGKEMKFIFKNWSFGSVLNDYSNHQGDTKSLITFRVFKKQYIYRKARINKSLIREKNIQKTTFLNKLHMKRFYILSNRIYSHT